MNKVILENIEKIRERIERAAQRCGRTSGEISLMAVTKTVDADRIRLAAENGMRLFGENRVQEAREKRDAFPPGAELHLIGHLQRNKARHAAVLFSMVQSIDRTETGEALAKELSFLGKRADILLEVNTSGEDSKHGVRTMEELLNLIEGLRAFPELTIRGAMTIAPFTGDVSLVRNSFRSLRLMSERAAAEFPELDFSTLSMGMSSDFEVAIEEGSTLVRIGTAIFGTR